MSELEIYRDALDRIARGEFATELSAWERLLSMRRVAREALGKGTALFFAQELRRKYGAKADISVELS